MILESSATRETIALRIIYSAHIQTGTSLGHRNAKLFSFFRGPKAQAVGVKASVFSPEQDMKL